MVTHGGRRDTGLDAVGWAEAIAAAGAGEILHDGQHTIGEAKAYLARAGVPVRLAPEPAPAGGGRA